ncbi:MAG: serine hydrolase [Proteobacteria bacterium]|nr:serine hydrolase [Pseudomonadota bacterium]
MRLTASLVWHLALCFLGTSAMAQVSSPLPMSAPSKEGFSAARLERLGSFMQSVIAAGDYPGAVTLISRNGRIVDWRIYGYRDLARKIPMTRDSIFRIYSMTKTVTSVAVLMLMEEGKLGLDDPVAKFLPEFADIKVLAGGTAEAPRLRTPQRPITVRHLLTHTAGFATRKETDDEAVKVSQRVDPHSLPTLQAYTSHVARQALAVDPGERFNYDGTSTETLSRLVETVAGMPFDAFLRNRILSPLKMDDTDFSVPHEKRDRVVDMVTTTAEGQLARTGTPDAVLPGESLNPYPSGAGGLYSTAGDYWRFCQMLLNGGSLDGVSILGRKTVELMMTSRLAEADLPAGSLGKGEGFGLGGYVVTDIARRDRLGSVGQFGWSGAGSTYFTIDPKEKLVAMLLMQHIRRGLPKDPPKISARFYNLVYQSLVD